MMVTRLAWMAHRLASSNSLTRYASAASWRHSIAADWNRRSVLKSWAISLTNLWKGNFRMSSAEVFWKWRMSCRATVPALYLWGFTCLPCILASCIFLFCSSVQSKMRWPSKVLSFVREMYRTGSFRSIGGVTCGLLARLLASHHWLWWCIFAPCLPALVRVIIFTIVVPASLFTFGPAYILPAGTGAVTTTCTTCGLLLDRFCPICQLWTFVVGGVLVPVDFGHWDLLSMLLLEIGDEFSHLVGTPTPLCKSLLQSSRQAVVDEKGGEGFRSSDVSWARWQGEVNLLLHACRCLHSLRWLWGILIWSLIRGVFQHHLPVRSSPWRRVLLWGGLSSSSPHG